MIFVAGPSTLTRLAVWGQISKAEGALRGHLKSVVAFRASVEPVIQLAHHLHAWAAGVAVGGAVVRWCGGAVVQWRWPDRRCWGRPAAADVDHCGGSVGPWSWSLVLTVPFVDSRL